VASLSNLRLIDIEMRKTVSDHLYHIRLYLVASLSNLTSNLTKPDCHKIFFIFENYRKGGRRGVLVKGFVNSGTSTTGFNI
jgi:hypothetical protein